MKKRKLSMVGMALIALMLMMVGCSSNSANHSAAEGERLSETGTLVLKVNPEIAIEYNAEGLVTRLTGKNDDGEKIVDTYSDYIGKDSGVVLEELIALMSEAGYFVEEVEGEKRQIVLELEAGSALPQENFLEVLAAKIQQAVSNVQADADVVKVEETEQKKSEEPAQAKTKETEKEAYIGMERAKKIAENHAGADASQVRWEDAEFDLDDGVPHYELEFDVGPDEYEYDIHAVSGEIMDVEQDIEVDKKRETIKEQKPAQKQAAAPKEMTKEEAINIALNHAGLERSEVVFDDIELDHDDGRKEWEIEFDSGQWEYEYEIDASNGKILDFEKELDD